MKRQVSLSLIPLFASLLLSCAVGRPPAATLTPPADSSPTPSPPPESTPTENPYKTPTPPLAEIGIPGFDSAGPAIVYDGFKLSNYDGSRRKAIPVEVAISPLYLDYSRESGRIVSIVDGALWTFDLRTGVQRLLSVNASADRYIESPVISRDGTRIAYSLVYGFGEDDIQQLWTVNADGSGNELAIDDTGRYIADPGPFRLIPFAWSLDSSRVYMVTTTDSEASPVGMYVADVVAGTVEKALTPPVTLWDVSLSPDRTKIAYRTFRWTPVEGSMPEMGPPFTLQVTDLTSGATRVLEESNSLEYRYPVWSEDGNRIAYAVQSHETGGEVGLFSTDLTSGASLLCVPGSEGSQLRPWLWLSDDRLVYTEEELSGGLSVRAALYTINRDGTDRREIDSSASIRVIGILDQ